MADTKTERNTVDPETRVLQKRNTRQLRDGDLPGALGRPAEQMQPLEPRTGE
jgi:hypothetical protein